MIRSIKFSQTEKVLAGALSIVALSAGVVIADQQPTGQTMAIESASDSSQINGVSVGSNPLPMVDGVLAEDITGTTDGQPVIDSATANTDSVVTPSSDTQGSGNVTENVSVTVDGKDVASDTFGDNGVSVTTDNTGTLDGSNNGTDVNVDHSVDQNTRNRNRVRNDSNIDANVGHNNVSGNENPVTVTNGNIKINFSLPQ